MAQRVPVVRAATIRGAPGRRRWSVPAAPTTGAAVGVARQVGDLAPRRDPLRAQGAKAGTWVAEVAVGRAAGGDLEAEDEVVPVAAAGDVVVRASAVVAEGVQEAGVPVDLVPEPAPAEAGDRVVPAGWRIQLRQVGRPVAPRLVRKWRPAAPEPDRPVRLKPWPSRRRAGAP